MTKSELLKVLPAKKWLNKDGSEKIGCLDIDRAYNQAIDDCISALSKITECPHDRRTAEKVYPVVTEYKCDKCSKTIYEICGQTSVDFDVSDVMGNGIPKPSKEAEYREALIIALDELRIHDINSSRVDIAKKVLRER